MKLNYESAKHLEGKMIRYRNINGEWVVGKVIKVEKDGLEIEEIDSSNSNDGYGFCGPFFRPFFFPFEIIIFDPFFFFF